MNGIKKSKSYNITIALLSLAGFIATVIVNALANILPINNRSTGAISDSYPNLFVPVGLTFSIWGLIYILLAIFVIYQLIIAFKSSERHGNIIRKAGILFFLSSLFNIGWIFAWHYEIIWLSLVMMILLFISLLSIYLRLKIGKSETVKTEKALVFIPFSVYMGWITIATIANVTALLVSLGWNGFGLAQQFWAVLVIAVGILISLAVVFTRNDIFYCFVIIWSLLGILLNRLADTGTPVQFIIIITIIGMVIIFIGIIVQLVRKKKIY